MRLVDVPVGTKLNATVTTTSTSSTQRTVQSLTGKVWFAQGTTVILTLPDGKNRQYNVTNRDIKFKVDGRDATLIELRKGMTVSAEKIVEEPVVEVATNVAVTGSAPPAPVAKAEPTPAAPAPRPAPTPAPAAKQTPPPPPPPPPAEPAPAKLPKTGSPLPLIGLLGGLMTAAGLGLRQWRRR
jgi:LPXTG-motif cell wall-anchored protein